MAELVVANAFDSLEKGLPRFYDVSMGVVAGNTFSPPSALLHLGISRYPRNINYSNDTARVQTSHSIIFHDIRRFGSCALGFAIKVQRPGRGLRSCLMCSRGF